MTAYMMLNTERTGSNLLAELLSSTGVAGINGVERAGFFVGWGSPALKNNGPEKINEYLRDSTTPNGVTGCKGDFRYLDHIRASLPQGAVEGLMGMFDHFIHITRNDLVAQAVSFYIAGATGEFTSLNIKPPPKRALIYDKDRIAWIVSRIVGDNARMNRWFYEQDIVPLRVSYEVLVNDMYGTVGKVLDFINVPMPEKWEPLPTLQQQHDQRKLKWVTRYKQETGHEIVKAPQ